MVKKDKKIKKEKVIAPFWPEMIAIHFDFCKKHFNTAPVFDGSAPRDLKSIVLVLKKRAENESLEWNLKTASERLGNFFIAAYNHKDTSGKYWLREHWTLFNLNRQKEIIFFNRKQKQDVGREENRSTSEVGQRVKPSGSFGQL